MEKPKKSAMEKAMRLLSRRALSERELLNKLCAAGYPFREARDAVAGRRLAGGMALLDTLSAVRR